MTYSIPPFMQQFSHLDLRNEENLENSYSDLVREIYNETVIRQPTLGAKPKFSQTCYWILRTLGFLIKILITGYLRNPFCLTN